MTAAPDSRKPADKLAGEPPEHGALTPAHARILTRLAFSGYFMVGVAAIIYAPMLPEIIAEFNLSLTVAGLLFPAMSLGGLFGGFVAGPLADRYGTKPVILAGTGLSAIGFLITALSPTWWPILAGFACMGVGQRAMGTSLNMLVAQANPDQSGKYLNYLHGVYGLGALLAPLVIGAALLQQVPWRLAFGAPVALWALFALATARPTYPPRPNQAANGAAGKATGKAADKHTGKTTGATGHTASRHTVFILLILVAFGYNGVAVSLLGWVKTYLDLTGELHPFLSTSMISIFYTGLTLGRFTCGAVSRRLGYPTTILACAAGTALTYPLAALSTLPLLLVPGVFFSGLFLSGLYPTALAIATDTFKRRMGAVTGVMTTALTAGSMIPPWWTGAVADAWGFQTALTLNAWMVLMLLASAAWLVRTTRSEQNRR